MQRVARGTFAALDPVTGFVLTIQYAKRDSDALKAVVDAIWERRKLEALERAGWKCERCGKHGPLHVHHKLFRSHGRDDRLSNLIVLCEPCHREKHGGF